MSLSRHLSLLLVLLVVALSSSGMVVSITQFRAFAAQKLIEQTQETANSIAIAIGQQPLTPRNAGVISSAYIDRGDLQTIKVVDRNANVFVDQVSSLAPSDVPSWFQSWVKLPSPEVVADIVYEWQPVGSVMVTTKTDSVYLDIWQLFISTVIASGVMTLLAVVFSFFSLRRLLQPLKAIEQQAVAIGEKKYVLQEVIPEAPELAAIVRAMNHMSKEIESTFNNYSKTIDQLYDLANKDQVTGWLRREPFLLKVKDLLMSGEASPGIFAVINLGDLQALNREIGYEKVNEWIISSVVGLMDVVQNAELSVCGRVRGAELAVIAVGVTIEEASLRMRATLHALAQQAAGSVQPVAALIQFDQAPEVSLLFKVVDEMLASGAGSSEPLQRRHLAKEAEPKSRQLWRDILRATFELQQPNTQFVPIKSSGLQGKSYLRAWLECLGDDDEPLNARTVEALCREEGLGLKHSLALLRAAKAKLDASKTPSICVPVMLKDMVEGGALVTELMPMVVDSRYGSRLTIEFTEFDALRHHSAVSKIVEYWRQKGIGVGMSKVSGYLPTELWINWRLTYIVLDSSWCLASENDHHTLVWQQFVKSARERGILVWSEWSGNYETQRLLGDWVDGWVIAPEHTEGELSNQPTA